MKCRGKETLSALNVFIYLRWSLRELRTTEMELKAMAADAIMGLSLPSAATGIATVL